MALHSFDPEVAAEVGVNAATLYQNIKFWIEKNEANEKHEYEGRYWMYNSMKAFSRLFTYLSTRQIRTALDKLLEAEFIGKGNFNHHKYDRTLWYCDLRQPHLTEKSQGEDLKDSPIPDSKPDTKTDTPLTPKGKTEEIFEKLWKEVMSLTPKELKGRHVKKTCLAKFKKITSRKREPIAGSRIAHAVLHYYDQDPQKKEDRRFMKGLGPVLNSEAFSVYLDSGPFKIRTEEDAELDEWRFRVDYVNQNGGAWPPGTLSPRHMPRELRDLVEERYRERLFGKGSQGGLKST